MLRKIGIVIFRSLLILSAVVFVISLFLYFRIIKPFVKLKGVGNLPSATILKQKSVVIDGMEYSYWTNSVTNPRAIVVMLPPSTNSGNIFELAMPSVPEDVLVIAPDYPGRGKTSEIKGLDTMQSIARRTSILLEKLLGRQSFYIIAPSLGGAVGTEVVKNTNLKVKKIFLIATGEFFNPDQKFVFRLLFTPPIYSERLRSYYENLIIGRLGFFKDVKKGTTKNILEQVIAVIDYKIDPVFTSNIPAVIVTLSDDKIVEPSSLAKLQRVFPDNMTLSITAEHERKVFSDPNLFKLIESNIE